MAKEVVDICQGTWPFVHVLSPYLNSVIGYVLEYMYQLVDTVNIIPIPYHQVFTG